MGIISANRFLFFQMVIYLLVLTCCSCKKEPAENNQIKPPVRSYDVTARADKKGTNTNSDGTAELKGIYNEGTKILTYRLVYDKIKPEQISLRNGPKGSKGTLITEIYNNTGIIVPLPLTGSITLTPLQERNLLKGLWFVAVNSVEKSPEISGALTLKQK